MNRIYIIIENLIALLLLIWSCLNLYISLFMAYSLADLAKTYHLFGWEKISFLTVAANYYLSISFELITIFGSILLLFNKKAGWIILISVSLINALYLAWILFKFLPNNGQDFTLTFSRIIGTLLFFLFVFLLTRLPYRKKYLGSLNTF